MGSLTDPKIAAWQKRAGITPATGHRAEVLHRTSQAAFALIKIIELEASGIRRGDGYWDGADAMAEIAQEVAGLCSCLTELQPAHVQPVEHLHTIVSHFGGCPICHTSNGFLNVGSEHYFVCHEHKTKWGVGSNIFSCWREESEDEWLCNKYSLANYRTVEPFFPEPTEEEWCAQAEREARRLVLHPGGRAVHVNPADDPIPF